MKKYITNDNKYIEWLENNMNSYELFYYKDCGDIIKCYSKSDDSEYCIFYKNIIDNILGEENIPILEK